MTAEKACELLMKRKRSKTKEETRIVWKDLVMAAREELYGWVEINNEWSML